jgi:hypothetical protein
MVDRIADLVATGLSLQRSLKVENARLTMDLWGKALQRKNGLSKRYDQRLAQNMRDMLMEIKESGTKGQPLRTGLCWILERSPELRNEYAQHKPASSVSVNVQVIGLQDSVVTRLRTLARRLHQDKNISKAIDVTSSVTPASQISDTDSSSSKTD